jgi:hypothetical protein
MTTVLLVLLGHVTFVGCEGSNIDQALVQGLTAALPTDSLEVRCSSADRVVITQRERGRQVLERELELPAGTATVRARTIAFVLGELAVGRVPVERRDAGNHPQGIDSTGLSRNGGAGAAGPHGEDGGAEAGAGVRVASAADGGGTSAPGARVTSSAESGEPATPGSRAASAADGGSSPAAARLASAADGGTSPAGELTFAAPADSPDAGRSTANAPPSESPAADGGRRAPGPELAPPLLAANVHTNPVDLAILPYFSLNQLLGTPARNYLAIALLAQDSTWLDGLAVAPVSYVEEDVRGVQLSALVSRTQHDVTGAQLSFGVNWTSGRVRGVQIGSTSFAGPVEGLQLGLLNIAGDVSGAQVGLINIARSVSGVQVGLFNIARSSVAPVGVINVIDDTVWRFAFELSESSLITGEMKLGGQVLYSVVSIGWAPRGTFRLGGGIGAHIGHGHGWYFEVEALALSLWDTHRASSWADQLSVGLRVNVGYQVGDRIALYAGTGAQLLFTPATSPGAQFALWSLTLSPTVTLVPAAAAGVQF